MQIQAWGDSITGSFQNIWGGVIGFLPALVAAIIIFVIGWVIGSLVGKLIAHIIRTIKLDTALEQAGLGHVMKRAGFNLNSGAFIGGLVEWFIIIAFLVASLQVLGLTQVNLFLAGVVLAFLPRVIVAVLVLLAAIVIGDVLSKIVMGSSRATGVRSANLLGVLTRWTIWIFALFVALQQVGIADQLIQAIFNGVVVALSLAFGLSFGLGGQDAAARWIEKTRDEMKTHHE
ncbi:MAG TPA: hypothetical protein VFT82_04075 [Candidatus Paceibacterota bacterium]|nr:hypothetical protein [Candidatus Paceibacterota bacterium]